eukprot:Blabericola_migrator_1__5527@NODE_281_length_10429_cov_52_996912_g231_i0_p8_GENE_NODE_281_length_10429_cov_52_996912_g231_i0NODE_281_length_10429_cov_52_996912_g231_i0_p8_ORF_typecomplete_len260_score43_32_NODE_281_length_10429_cov_52_996912_g231_i019122691
MYGIREIQVSVPGMRPVIVECAEARKSVDARNLFFFVAVSSFREDLVSSFKKSSDGYEDAASSLLTQEAKVDATTADALTVCSNDLHSMAESSVDFTDRLTALNQAVTAKVEAPKAVPDRCSNRAHWGLQHSASRAYSSEAGYYSVRDACYPDRLRVYCPADDAVGLYVLTDPEQPRLNVTGAQDIARLCAQKGLLPLNLSDMVSLTRTARLIEAQQLCSTVMEEDHNLFVPVAFSNDLQGKEFRDFNNSDIHTPKIPH